MLSNAPFPMTALKHARRIHKLDLGAAEEALSCIRIVPFPEHACVCGGLGIAFLQSLFSINSLQLSTILRMIAANSAVDTA